MGSSRYAKRVEFSRPAPGRAGTLPWNAEKVEYVDTMLKNRPGDPKAAMLFVRYEYALKRGRRHIKDVLQFGPHRTWREVWDEMRAWIKDHHAKEITEAQYRG